MRSFRYSMESVLDYRKNIEEDEKQKFSQLQREYITQDSILKDVEEKSKKAKDSLFKGKQDTIGLKKLQQYIEFLSQRIQLQKQSLEQLKLDLDGKREEMVFAQRDRKIIEKHKEKSFDQYRNKMEHLEQKNIDELALYVHMRR